MEIGITQFLDSSIMAIDYLRRFPIQAIGNFPDGPRSPCSANVANFSAIRRSRSGSPRRASLRGFSRFTLPIGPAHNTSLPTIVLGVEP